MQYQTPQFIEIEDKIFGPLTFKQFLYLAGGGGLCVLMLTIMPRFLAIILSLPVAALSLGLAFYQVNGQPFIQALEHAFNYQFGAKLYLWKQREATAKAAPLEVQKTVTADAVPKLTQSKLRDLSWSLNIKDQVKYEEVPKTPSGQFRI